MFGVKGQSAIGALWEMQTVLRFHHYGLEGFKAEVEKIDEETAVVMGGANDNEQDAYFRDINDDYIDFAENMPLLQTYSTFLILYMMLERALNNSAIEILLSARSKLELKDFSGLGIRRARTIIEKMADSGDVFSSKAWERALLFGEIRNKIIHELGFVKFSPNDGGLVSKLSAEKFVSFESESLSDDDGRIILSPEFIDESSTVFAEILLSVFRITQSVTANEKVA